MSKVVDVVVDTGGDIFGLGRSVFNKTVGALWDSLTPDLPEEDLATLAKGLQKGIDQPRRITFGRDRVGGVIAHQAEVERGEKKFVQMVVLINGAPIDALEEIYIADKPITDYPGESWDYELSDGRHTTANTKAVAKMAGWTNEHIGIDQAHIFIELENNREVFEDGISETEFLIRGARVWDPRDTTQNPDDETTWAWSQNAVLCALHYVRFYGAHEVPFDRLPLGWWIAAINVCDEDAEFKDAAGKLTTEKRYTTNGSFTFSSKPLDVLNQLEGCFAGKIFRQMGQWYVRVGAWYGNPTYTINADDVHGNIKIKWHADLRDRANVVRATFTDPMQNYDRTDAPPVVSAGYQAIDNQILEKSITLPFVRSGTTAQRLATIHLEQTRLGEIELPLKHKGLAAAVGRTVYLNLPSESINNKVYRVVERRFRLDGGVTLMCVEDGPDLWADNLVPGAQDLTPNSDYLVGKPQPIFDVRVTIDGDGNGIIKWNHPAPLAVNEYDIEFINTVADEQVFKTSVTYTQVTIPNLQLGEYTARISAKNIFGQRSLLVAVQFSVLTPTLPTVYVTADYNQITLTADIATAGIGTAFEWEFLGTTESPQISERVLAQIYNRIGLKSETEYKFRVRSVNHLGASAWVDVIASTTLVDLTEFINGVELTQLSENAQTLIDDMNTQVDRLRPGTQNNLPDLIASNIGAIDLQRIEQEDLALSVLDVAASYTNWRTEYERRTFTGEMLVDAAVFFDPLTGKITNRAYSYTDESFNSAALLIDGVKSTVTLNAEELTRTKDRLISAESELVVQAGKISQRATFSEVESQIAGALEALQPAYSWQFNSGNEGFNPDSHNVKGYIITTTEIISSPLIYNATENPIFRLRVRKHANTTWKGRILFNDHSTVIPLPEPTGPEWEVVSVDATGTMGYEDAITLLRFDLGPCDIDFIEVGKRGANDLALKDITSRTSILETELNAVTGTIGQYATTAWINYQGYQTQSNVNQMLDSFNSTYKVSATLQEFSDNGTLEKANNAQSFINGAEAYIEDRITTFIGDGPEGIGKKLSDVTQRLDAAEGLVSNSVSQIIGLGIESNDKNINEIINEYHRFKTENKINAQELVAAFANEKLKAHATDLESQAEKSTQLTTLFNKNSASLVALDNALSNTEQALTESTKTLTAKIGKDTLEAKNAAIATAQQYTRTAVGHCVNAEGQISSESDAVACVASGGSWVAGPLAEFIENLQISEGGQTASIKQMRQVFKTIDGELVARGGWQLDNNGRAVGVVGYNDGQIGNLDLVGDVIRQGVMVGNAFIPTSYIDNTDPAKPVHTFRGRMILGDGHTVESLDDIKAQDGADGKDGGQGPQGVPGVRGADGQTTYTWIKYADNASGGGLSNSPNNKEYIGFAYNKTSSTELDTASLYTWSKIKGEDGINGTNGVPGAKGADGKTTYTWIAYSDNANGSGMYQTPNTNTKYIGIAVNKDTATEQNTPSLYTWSLFRGEKGETGATGDKGSTGDTGNEGKRGAEREMVGTSSGIWYDSVAKAAMPGGVAVLNDIVTIYKASDPAVETTKRFDGTWWNAYTLRVHGDSLLDGTVDGKVFRASSRIESPIIMGGEIVITEPSSDYLDIVGRSTPFGPTTDLISWYGPKINGVTWNSSTQSAIYSGMSKSNAVSYKTNNGSFYFGGTFQAGTLSISRQATNTSGGLNVVTGSFTIPGGTTSINITASVSGQGSAYGGGSCPATPYKPSSAVDIEMLVGGTWQAIAGNNAQGSVSCIKEGPEIILSVTTGVSANTNLTVSSGQLLQLRATARTVSFPYNEAGLQMQGDRSVSIVVTGRN